MASRTAGCTPLTLSERKSMAHSYPVSSSPARRPMTGAMATPSDSETTSDLEPSEGSRPPAMKPFGASPPGFDATEDVEGVLAAATDPARYPVLAAALAGAMGEELRRELV